MKIERIVHTEFHSHKTKANNCMVVRLFCHYMNCFCDFVRLNVFRFNSMTYCFCRMGKNSYLCTSKKCTSGIIIKSQERVGGGVIGRNK